MRTVGGVLFASATNLCSLMIGNGNISRRTTARTVVHEWTVKMMRLIDADELKMYLIQANEWQEIITMDDVLEFIERQTLIDTSKNLLYTINVNMDTDEVMERLKERGWEPVKHGRWDLIDGCEPVRYGCSVCHRMVWHHENYCPYCGARMDQEADHDDHL